MRAAGGAGMEDEFEITRLGGARGPTWAGQPRGEANRRSGQSQLPKALRLHDSVEKNEARSEPSPQGHTVT